MAYNLLAVEFVARVAVGVPMVPFPIGAQVSTGGIGKLLLTVLMPMPVLAKVEFCVMSGCSD